MSVWSKIGSRNHVGLALPPLAPAGVLYLAYRSKTGSEEITHRYNVDTCEFTPIRTNHIEVLSDNGATEFWIDGELAAFFNGEALMAARFTQRGNNFSEPAILFYYKNSSGPTLLASISLSGSLSGFRFQEARFFGDEAGNYFSDENGKLFSDDSAPDFSDSKFQFRFFNGDMQIASIGPNGLTGVTFRETALFTDESGNYFSDENQNLLLAR